MNQAAEPVPPPRHPADVPAANGYQLMLTAPDGTPTSLRPVRASMTAVHLMIGQAAIKVLCAPPK